jgi:hypothetical protein
MRFFNRFYDPNGNRFALPEFLQAFGNRLRGRTVAAAGVG